MNTRYKLNLQTMDACISADIPVFLWGSPGSGKSSAVRRWAADRGYRLTELTPSILDPTDLLGLPYQTGDGATRFAPPDWLHAILAEPGEKHLIFLDNLNLSAASVMAACLRLVLERAVHTTVLPPGVRFAAAGNDPAQVPSAHELTPPLANRFAHIEWEGLYGSEWLSAMIADWPLPPAPEETDRDWLPTAGAFLDIRQHLADDYETGDGKAAENGRGYPSARAWHALCRALRFAGDDEDLLRAVSVAVIGPGAAGEFASFVAAADLPSPKDWLADPALARPLDRDDQTAAALLAVAVEVSRPPIRSNVIAAGLGVISRAAG